MSPLVRLDWDLSNARESYKTSMCRSITNYIKRVNLAYHYIRMYPPHVHELRKRIILRDKTQALIAMDKEQLQAVEVLKFEKFNASETFASTLHVRPVVSPWFVGEPRAL